MADDLRRLAEQAEPDQAGPEDQATELMEAHGISAVPADRGLSLVTRLEDCPLPDGYVIPEPYWSQPTASTWSGTTAPGMRVSPGRGCSRLRCTSTRTGTIWWSWPGATAPGGCPG